MVFVDQSWCCNVKNVDVLTLCLLLIFKLREVIHILSFCTCALIQNRVNEELQVSILDKKMRDETLKGHVVN